MRGTTKTGSAPGRKNAPVTQPCAYEDSPNVGDVAFDAGQVLEIGGRGEEERLDTGVLQSLGEPPAALRVVEHAPSLARVRGGPR